MFARHYASELETFLNRAVEGRVLVAAEMENAYLFPLNTTKIVTIPLGPQAGFGWFAWMSLASAGSSSRHWLSVGGGSCEAPANAGFGRYSRTRWVASRPARPPNVCS